MGDASVLVEGFQEYANLIHADGILILRNGLKLTSKATILTYAVNDETADYTAFNLRFSEGKFLFDVKSPSGKLLNFDFGLPGIHNAENALACIALCQFLGLSEESIRYGLKTFKGVKRRFEFHIRKDNLVYIDDYAHHPTEINALVSSVRMMYPGKRIIGAFQPHLFSRTRDFFDGFVEELSKLDEVVLLPIYPAREEPIPGVTSDSLLDKLTSSKKQILTHDEALNYLKNVSDCIVLTIGAGDIDKIVKPLEAAFKER